LPAETPRRIFSALRIVPLLAGLLLAAGLLPIMVGGYIGARNNTAQLLTDNRDALLDGLEEQLRATFDGAAAQARLIAKYLETPDVEPMESRSISPFMLGAATSTGSLEAVGYLGREGPLKRWVPGGSGVETIERSQIAVLEPMWRSIEMTRTGSWSEPLVSRVSGRGLLAYRQPVIRNGEVAGIVIVAIAWDTTSSMLMSTSAPLIPFVLYDRNSVFIHPNMKQVQFKDQRLPGLGDVNDYFLSLMWKDPRQSSLPEGGRSRLHWTWTGQGYEAVVFAYREIKDYGLRPWIIGYHQDSLETFRVRWVVQAIYYGSVFTLLAGLLITWWLTRKAIRPVARIADASRALERLDFTGVSGHLDGDSRIKEINDTSHALQSAAVALQRFQTYVPRALVKQVMAMGEQETAASDREVTILFMDLSGYTAFSAGRSASAVGAYLNGIFSSIGPIIEANGGSIDKYTGDGLMAVWGAPVADAHHAASAWRAVQAILAEAGPRMALAVQADPAACRMRLGLHCGKVLAGNIGFTGRMDYTVIGRTVNIAQRAQGALKGHMGDAAVALAVTETARRTLDLPEADLAALPDLKEGERVYRYIGAAR
jgi:adenylate cyclase